MIKQVISVEQLIELAYCAGMDAGFIHHQAIAKEYVETNGGEMIAARRKNGVREFNQFINENFVVDY